MKVYVLMRAEYMDTSVLGVYATRDEAVAASGDDPATWDTEGETWSCGDNWGNVLIVKEYDVQGA